MSFRVEAIAKPPNAQLIPSTLPKGKDPPMLRNTGIADLPPNTPSIEERKFAGGLKHRKCAHLSPIVRAVYVVPHCRWQSIGNNDLMSLVSSRRPNAGDVRNWDRGAGIDR
jgi:hypothetical protein